MKILFIAPEIPWPLNKGTCQRTYAMLKTLSLHHQITFSAPVEDDYQKKLLGISELIDSFVPVSVDAIQRKSIPKAGGRIRRFCNFIKSLIRSEPPFNFQMQNSLWHDQLYSEIQKHDLFFCRYSYLHSVFKNVPSSKLLIDIDDLQYLALWRKAVSWNAGMESFLIAVESIRTRFYERKLVNLCRQAFVCSELDKTRFRSENVTVVRNGVSLSGAAKLDVEPNPNTLLFIGAFTYAPNLEGLKWFCREVWPLVKRRNSEAVLRVAGYGMDKEQMSFAHIDGVMLIGEVDDSSIAIRQAMLMIVPLLYGTGTRVKIAEALGYGRPVVSTIIGAEGYDDFTETEGLFRVATNEQMAQRILELLADSGFCLELGNHARQTAIERLDWIHTTKPILSFM
ncbi:glycosyltransferase [Pseudomaricurvus alcaniphilus]|uniref:glycosyltransferase n=1 Tax=Pseudomaricurvus alcaniphilus TaxID=1166482 RepID=UPI001407B8A4|nr:glycosyltransferase [Pseudomaricurvus alcaniphilus]NHN36727.1 glycosyltransferase [Pseudomaricurvus alcaniphilus]